MAMDRGAFGVDGRHVEAAGGEDGGGEDEAGGGVGAAEFAVRLEAIQEAVGAADVDGAIVGDERAGRADGIGGGVVPELGAGGGVEGVDFVVVAAEVDVAAGIEGGGAGERRAGVEVPALGAVGADGEEAAVVTTEVDRAIGAEGGRGVGGGAEIEAPFLRAVGCEGVELVVVGSDVDGAIGGD